MIEPSGASMADILAEHFDQLLQLTESQRLPTLAALAIPDSVRTQLAALLAADALDDARLERVVSKAAQRVGDTQDKLPENGARLGAWRVLHEIGAGGMGTVFLAERADGSFEQRVAIKLLRGFPTEDGRRRLRLERHVLAQLDHPYIAHLLDAGESGDGQPYFVMELVEGVRLNQFAAGAALSCQARVGLVDRIAEAVSHAHQRLVIHRDLKPSNVLVRADGTPKLLDFGVAKLVDLSEGVVADSTRVWTPGYASPEQKAGQPVTTATDVFALGTLLRELLTAMQPDGVACEPAFAAVPIDADLSGILLKATAHAASERYPTVEAFRDDLARWREGRPVRAARDGALYRARKFVQRHRGSVSLAVLVGLALTAFVWRLGVERNRALAAETLAEQRRVQAEQSADTARGTLEFFGGLIAELSPDADIDSPITLRRMLERGTDRIGRELSSSTGQVPLVNAYLGSLYGVLGEPATALPLLQGSLEAMIAQGLDSGPTFGSAAREYANVLVETGRLSESFAWLARSAAAFRRAGGPNNVAEASLSEVQSLIFAERYSEAEAVASPAIARARAAGVAVRVEVLATLQQQLAVILNSAQRAEEAEAICAEGLAHLDDAGLARSMFVFQFEQERGKAQLALNRPLDALASFDRARAIYLAGRGEAGFLLVILDDWRVEAMKKLGKMATARALLESNETRWSKFGRTPDALSRLGIAHLYWSEGDAAKGLTLARALLVDAKGFVGLTPNQVYSVRLSAARIIGQAGDAVLARRVIAAEIARSATESEGFPSMSRWQLALADIALANAEIASAQSAIEEASHSLQRESKVSDALRADVARTRARIALAQGRTEAAEPDLLAWAQFAASTSPYQRAVAELDLAALRSAQGRNEEARAILQLQLPLLRAAVLPKQTDRARAEALARELEMSL